jgi:hypothetical protein
MHERAEKVAELHVKRRALIQSRSASHTRASSSFIYVHCASNRLFYIDERTQYKHTLVACTAVESANSVNEDRKQVRGSAGHSLARGRLMSQHSSDPAAGRQLLFHRAPRAQLLETCIETMLIYELSSGESAVWGSEPFDVS